MQPLQIQILQALNKEYERDPLQTLDSEELAQQIGVPWEAVRQEIPYLEHEAYIETERSSRGIRRFIALRITTKGINSLNDRKAPPPPKEAETTTLTLRIVPKGKQATVTWDGLDSGHHVSRFRPPYDATTLPLVIKALDAIQYPDHPLVGPKFDLTERAQLTKLGLWKEDRVVADIDRRVGRTLYDRLLENQSAKIALESTRNNAIAGGKALTYLLRFTPEAVELAALPWELLHDEANPLMLSRGQLASFVRCLDLEHALPPSSQPSTSLHILAVAPNALIPQEIRAAEREARDRAWAKLKEAGIVTQEELSPATVTGLVKRIQDKSRPMVDILHFYGHGRYKDGRGELLFDTPEGDRAWLGADKLAGLLGKTRLVLLHACQSAMVSDAGLLTGVAPALTAAGVPIVVAMQLTIRIDAATRFAEIVYTDLAHGEFVQHAVSRARQALFVETTDGASWYVPTLTIRSRDAGPIRLVQPQQPS